MGAVLSNSSVTEAIALDLIQRISIRDWTGLEHLFSQDVKAVNRALSVDAKGKEAATGMFKSVVEAFPDMVIEVMHKSVEGDTAMLYVTWKGTHTQPFGSLPPTNKRINREVVITIKVTDGKISTVIVVGDRFSLLQSLGVALPETPALQKDPEDVEKLRASIIGRVVTPISSDYRSVAILANGDLPSAPAVIIQCQGVSDVMKAITFCKEFEKKNPTAPRSVVRGGGHSFSALSTNVGGCVIDLRRMRSVLVDPVERTAWVEGGATAQDLDREAFVHGLVTPAGQISHTGVGGLATAGGYGLLSHKYGFMIDNTLAVEMVTADGKVIFCSDKENPELFWAARGGARWLGVVTRFKFQLHKLPTASSNAILAWDISHLDKVYRSYRQLEKMNSAACFFVSSPPPLGGATVAILHLVVFGDLDKAKSVVDFLVREIGASPMAELLPLAERTWPEVNSSIDMFSPYGIIEYTRGFDIDGEDPEKCLTFLHEFLKGKPANGTVVIDYAAGEYCLRGQGNLGFFERNGARKPFYFGIVLMALNPENPDGDRPASKAFVDDFVGRIAHVTNKVPRYVNIEERTSFQERSSKDMFERFNKIKKQYDPDGFFGKHI